MPVPNTNGFNGNGPSQTPAATPTPTSGIKVLIAGAGIVGLTIAQGCLENNIPFAIFERDEAPDARAQGWALTLHWCLDSLERTIGPRLTKLLPTVRITFLLSLYLLC